MLFIEMILIGLILYNVFRIRVPKKNKSNPDIHYRYKDNLEYTVTKKLQNVFPNLRDLTVIVAHRNNTNACYLAFTNYGFILAALNAETKDAITDAWLVPYEQITGYQFMAVAGNNFWEEMQIHYLKDNSEPDYLYFRIGRVIKSSMIDLLEVNMRRAQREEV